MSFAISSHSSMTTLWIKIIIRICIRVSSLPYRFDVDALDNGRSIGIQIDQGTCSFIILYIMIVKVLFLNL